MTLRTGEERILSIAGGSSRSHYVEESFLEEALDLLFDRLLMMMMMMMMMMTNKSTLATDS